MKKILFLSLDSFTFGMWVDLDETYLKILEKKLNNNRDGQEFKVINKEPKSSK